MDIAPKSQAQASRHRVGAGLPGGCEVPSFQMEKMLGVPGRIFVTIQCTCNSCHLRLGPLMRPRTLPSGHSYSRSQRQQPSQRWHHTPAWIGGHHFLSCAHGLQEDSRGMAWVCGVSGGVSGKSGDVVPSSTHSGSWDVPADLSQLASLLASHFSQ